MWSNLYNGSWILGSISNYTYPRWLEIEILYGYLILFLLVMIHVNYALWMYSDASDSIEETTMAGLKCLSLMYAYKSKSLNADKWVKGPKKKKTPLLGQWLAERRIEQINPRNKSQKKKNQIKYCIGIGISTKSTRCLSEIETRRVKIKM